MGNHLSCFVSLQGYKENCGGYTEKKKEEGKKKLISEAMTSCAKMKLLILADQGEKKKTN